MVKIANGEELKPHLRLRLGIMDKFIRSDELATKATGDLINHHGRVSNGKVPELPTDLFFGDEGPGHGDDGTPCALSKAIGGLATCRSRDDVGFVGKNPLEGLSTDEFLVKVRMESERQAMSISSEQLEG